MVTPLAAPLAAARSFLFVPATRPERFEKAAAAGPDAVILDLEDAVAPPEKDAARALLRTGFTALPVVVRVNARGTPWHESDLAALAATGAAAVMLPKTEDPADVAAMRDALGDLPMIALVETARGLAHARAIAAAGATRLAFGSVDYCADLGCDHTREALLAARSELVLASRLGGLPAPVDGVTVRVDDGAEAQADARHAKSLGMGAKLCIHPRQVAAVADGFAPTRAEAEWARRVMAAGDGAVQVDGAMVDPPVKLRAAAILAALEEG